jgi:glycosyltransferase involved in cell wall biosynthesis
VVVGNGKEYAEKVVSFINKNGLTNRVHFINNTNNTELAGIYSAARITVNPSIYEGFGLPVLESMLCGTPVITTANSAMAEIAGTSGLYAESDDMNAFAHAINMAFHDEDCYQNVVNRIGENIEQFQPIHTSSLMNSYYKKFVKHQIQ